MYLRVYIYVCMYIMSVYIDFSRSPFSDYRDDYFPPLRSSYTCSIIFFSLSLRAPLEAAHLLVFSRERESFRAQRLAACTAPACNPTLLIILGPRARLCACSCVRVYLAYILFFFFFSRT